jgi:hypothetical protein
MQFDHDKLLLPFVKLSTSPYCTNISSQDNGTHYDDNAQHGARYNSTKRTTLPLPSKSQRSHLATINVHNDRPIDSAHFAQPMSHDSTYTSPSLAQVCCDRPADSTPIVSYIRRQYVRTVPNVDIVGSSKCHTRHFATGGVARFKYVLVTTSNPVTTCASDGRVNLYPNKEKYSTLSTVPSTYRDVQLRTPSTCTRYKVFPLQALEPRSKDARPFESRGTCPIKVRKRSLSNLTLEMNEF